MRLIIQQLRHFWQDKFSLLVFSDLTLKGKGLGRWIHEEEGVRCYTEREGTRRVDS